MQAISRALAFFAGVCLIMMMVHVVADVAAKYVLNMPIEGTLEIVSAYYMVAVVFLPLAIVELRREHIYVDMFVRQLPMRPRVWLYAFTGILTAGFFGLLAYVTFGAAMHSFKINEMMMGTSFIVVWPGRWFLPIGFGAVTLAIVLHVIKALLRPEEYIDAVAAPENVAVD